MCWALLIATTDLQSRRQYRGTSHAWGIRIDRNSRAVTDVIDTFIRSLTCQELTVWTQHVYKQSLAIKYTDTGMSCEVSEPVKELTNEHLVMPHLSLLSPDADLLAALISRNQCLEARNEHLEASRLATNAPEVARLPVQDFHSTDNGVNNSVVPVVVQQAELHTSPMALDDDDLIAAQLKYLKISSWNCRFRCHLKISSQYHLKISS
jgi:hypothetical protein